MTTPAEDALSAQVTATVAELGVAGTTIASLNSEIASLKAQIAAAPADNSALLTQLQGELKPATDALAAAIAAS